MGCNFAVFVPSAPQRNFLTPFFQLVQSIPFLNEGAHNGLCVMLARLQLS